jgi:hypothetical protein
VLQAGQASQASLSSVQRFFALPRAKELDDALFEVPAESAETPGNPAAPGKALTESISASISPATLQLMASKDSPDEPSDSDEPSESTTSDRSPRKSIERKSALDNPDTRPPARPRRGRPIEIPDDLKEKALRVTGGKARAKILYRTPYPTPQQVKNVPTILRHFKRKRQPKDE